MSKTAASAGGQHEAFVSQISRPPIDVEICEGTSVPKFDVGDQVRLCGLERAQFNHHVGTVVTPLGGNGRVGVSLHGTIWPDAHDKHHAIALRPTNLRRIPRRTQKALSVSGTISLEMIFIMFGEQGWGLPDNVVKHITEQLRVEQVRKDDIIVCGCSSSRGDFPIGVVLNEDRSEWWISAKGSMPDGYGSEYLEFSFGASPRRVEFVSLCIPPLPMGPLSVRKFHLLALDSSGSWLAVSPGLETLDRAELQEFALDQPIDTTSVRVVCTENAAAGAMDVMSFVDCTGLFQVSFA